MAVWCGVFFKIVSMSIMASILIVFVMGLRLLLNRAPKLFSYFLWSIVLFRLLCPVSIPSIFSIWNLLKIPAVENYRAGIGKEIFHTESNNARITDTQIDIIGIVDKEMANAGISDEEITNTGITEAEIANVKFINTEIIGSETVYQGMTGAEQGLFLILTEVWLSGVLLLASGNVFLLIRMRKWLNCSILLEKNIYLADYIRTPFAFGLMRPY